MHSKETREGGNWESMGMRDEHGGDAARREERSAASDLECRAPGLTCSHFLFEE